ncbi:MAG TPA: PilT/PilU family type 4a pilus ATPase [Myxococcales bacterium]|nr:PilT/PilU family type 4a pilus ATPase [Myxococcales bacterium]
MARLDPFIELLFKEKAEVLLLETGAAAALVKADTIRSVMQRTLTTAQIATACAELVPEPARETFSVMESHDFEYGLGPSRVRVRINPSGDGVRATFEPVGGNGEAKAAPAPAPADAPVPERPAPPPAAPAALPPLPDVHDRQSMPVGPPPAGAAEAMRQLLDIAVSHNASDLHLTSGFVPCLRVDGDVLPLDGYGDVTDERLRDMLFSIAPQAEGEKWLAAKDADFACETDKARFRVNLFAERAGIAAVLRRIPKQPVPAEELGIPRAVLELCHLRKGLIVVTGPSGSGRSTTLAALVDYVNRQREDHILTIEGPIEFVHVHKRCLVHQRAVGVHTDAMQTALRAAVREDPDVLQMGELRDAETIATAFEFVETGHLVLASLHTPTALATVDRIVDQFPADRHPQARAMLAESLKAVIAQTLVRKAGGGRAAAQEILLVNTSVANLIREGKSFQIPSIMQSQRATGMVTLTDALFDLVKRKVAAPKDALARASSRSELKAMLDRLSATPESGVLP